MTSVRRALAGSAAALLVLAGALIAPATAQEYDPSRPVECIAPADPGGGWDFTCRSVGKLLYDLGMTNQPVQVTNMPGGTGAVAYGHVTARRRDDPNLLVATSTVGITQIAQGRYPGDIDLMRWVAMVGTDVGVVVVREDAPYQSLNDFLNALKDDPTSATVAGSSAIGGWDHLRLLMLAQEAGTPGEDLSRIRWVQYDGGGPAVIQLMGGFIDAVSTDLAEIAGFIESGQVRALAVLSEERLPGRFASIPTAREQGFDVVGYNWRGFYVGGGVSDAAYTHWVDTLRSLFETPEWGEVAEGSGLNPIWRGGESFQAFVAEQTEQMRQLSRAIGIVQ